MNARSGFAIAVTAALLALPACQIETPRAGFHEGVIKDLDTNTPLPGVMVVGIFGYRVDMIEGHRFVCQGVQVVTTDTAGRYAFSRAQLPAEEYAYRAGYWTKWLPSNESPRPFGMTQRDPKEGAGSPLARRFVASRGAIGGCPDLHDDLRQLRSLHLAMAREALASQSDEDRFLGLDMCQLAAADDDHRPLTERYVFTEAEANRLKQIAPECLSPTPLVSRMRYLLRDSARKKKPTDDELLARAIIKDPAEYQKRKIASMTIESSRHGVYALSESLGCEVGLGLPERLDEFEANVREAGIPSKRNDRNTGLWVNCRDEDRVSKMAFEVMSDI